MQNIERQYSVRNSSIFCVVAMVAMFGLAPKDLQEAIWHVASAMWGYIAIATLYGLVVWRISRQSAPQ